YSTPTPANSDTFLAKSNGPLANSDVFSTATGTSPGLPEPLGPLPAMPDPITHHQLDTLAPPTYPGVDYGADGACFVRCSVNFVDWNGLGEGLCGQAMVFDKLQVQKQSYCSTIQKSHDSAGSWQMGWKPSCTVRAFDMPRWGHAGGPLEVSGSSAGALELVFMQNAWDATGTPSLDTPIAVHSEEVANGLEEVPTESEDF
ncbi:hypothetical protein E4T56_gene18923, partial [Termitomyces sp. T112]